MPSPTLSSSAPMPKPPEPAAQHMKLSSNFWLGILLLKGRSEGARPQLPTRCATGSAHSDVRRFDTVDRSGMGPVHQHADWQTGASANAKACHDHHSTDWDRISPILSERTTTEPSKLAAGRSGGLASRILRQHRQGWIENPELRFVGHRLCDVRQFRKLLDDGCSIGPAKVRIEQP